MLYLSLYTFWLLLSIYVQLIIAQSHWPPGTVASGSTEILGNQPFNDSFAIDGDRSTMWIDATDGEFPDILIIAMPESHKVSSIKILSNASGWPTHYTVENLSANNSWVQIADLRSIPSFISTAAFKQPVDSSQFRITVYNASTAPGQLLHTRINEVYPVYANETTSPEQPNAGAPPKAPFNQPLPSSEADHTGIIIGVVASVCMILTIALSILVRARRRNRRGQPQIWHRLYRRKKPPTDDKKILEVSTETLRVELDALYQTMKMELGGFRALGTELAGSDVPMVELPGASKIRTKGMLKVPRVEKKGSNAPKRSLRVHPEILMKELPKPPKTEDSGTSRQTPETDEADDKEQIRRTGDYV